MITRLALATVKARLAEAPAVALIGPRQVGKTTLAREIADERGSRAIYLDLEQPHDRSLLTDPAAYFARHEDKLIVLDEIHRAPELFSVLRGEVDARRRSGNVAGHFLILGSAALPMLRQTSESLAGRIIFVEMTPFLPQEITPSAPPPRVGMDEPTAQLWVRGGFPPSYLASSAMASHRWRLAFIRSYLERDIPQFGVRVPAATLERFWTMLAHGQGGLLNAQALAGSLGVAWHTANHYLNLMTDLLLVRRLPPWSANAGKRLVKSPKIYVRDTGLLHALLNLRGLDDVLAHPVAGASLETFAIEALIAAMPDGARAYFYRSQAGAEIDLVIEISSRRLIAIEIKSSSAPKVSKGFYTACEDLRPVEKLLVYPGGESFPIGSGMEATSISRAVEIIGNA